jgi:hypothetical protein
MKLYMLECDSDINRPQYDVYTSIVVCAHNEEDALTIEPVDSLTRQDDPDIWVKPDQLGVTYLGEACATLNRGVIHTHFVYG